MSYIIMLLVYLLSVYFTRLYFKIAFSKGGIWAGLEPDHRELCITILPIFNTYMLIFGFLALPPKEKTRKKTDYKKFFNIK